MKIHLFSTVILALIVLSANVEAQGGRQDRRGQRPDPNVIRLLDMNKSLRYLSLTDEQTDTIIPIIEELAKLYEPYNKERREMMQSMRGGQGNRSEMRSKIEELSKKYSNLEEKLKEKIALIEKNLTEKQLKKFKKVEKPTTVMQRGRGRRGGGGE